MMRVACCLLALSTLLLADGPAETLRRARECSRVVERLREKEFKQPVKMAVLTDEEVRKRMTEEYDEEFPVEKARGMEAAYAALGLLPRDMDLRKTMFDLELAEVAAFYDQKKKQLCLIASMKEDDPEDKAPWSHLVAVHELTHALQDQYHDLVRIDELRLVKDDGDVSEAVTCVIEGEAMLVMLQRMYEANGQEMPTPSQLETLAHKMLAEPEDKTSLLAKAPRILRESLTSPYSLGLRFVAEVHAKEGWAGVSDLLDTVPSSTEQILHPKKWFGDRKDFPQEVVVPDLADKLPKGFKEVSRDSLGEFGARIRLEEIGVPKSIGASASDGWDGDMFVAWNDGDKAHTAVAWATTWDTETDARQFYHALRDALVQRHQVPSDAVPKGEDAYAWKTADGGVAIEIKGKDVFTIEGCPGDVEATKAFLGVLWEKVTKKEVVRVEDVK